MDLGAVWLRSAFGIVLLPSAESGAVLLLPSALIRRPPLGVNAVYAQLLCCSALLLSSYAQLHIFVVNIKSLTAYRPPEIKSFVSDV